MRLRPSRSSAQRRLHPFAKSEYLESVSIGVLVDRIGRLSDDRMRQVCAALAVAVACD
jgi:mRNA interferase MazF